MKRKNQPDAESGDDEETAECVACEDYGAITQRRFSLAASTHSYQATEARWHGRRHSFSSLHYPCCGEREHAFCTGAFVGPDYHPGKLQGGPHNQHCLRKGGLGGAQLAWDCCKAISTVSGCTARPSGVFNTNYELCSPPKVRSIATIANWRASLRLLRQRFEVHAEWLDGTGPMPAPMPEYEEGHPCGETMYLQSVARSLSSQTPAELYSGAREDARVLLQIFERKLIPAVVGCRSVCIHRKDNV